MIISLREGNEWQYFDKDGELYPWYTKPVLDILEGMDLSNKIVWEYGVGASTCWYAKRAKMVYGVDDNIGWIKNVHETLVSKRLLSKSNLLWYDNPELYVGSMTLQGVDFDIIVVDGIERDACTMKALQVAKSGSIVILDNYLQNSVEIASQDVQDLVNKYPHKIYRQENHQDWATAIIEIP